MMRNLLPHSLILALALLVACPAGSSPTSPQGTTPTTGGPSTPDTPPNPDGLQPTPNPSDTAPSERWSDPQTWGGSVPAAGSSVTIPSGKRVILDVDATVAALTVMGTLEFDRKDLNLTASAIMLHGSLKIGSSTQPFTQKATITLNASDPSENIMGMGTRGILVMGGKLELYGKSPAKPWTKLADHAQAGATTLQLVDGVDWQPGDQIVIAPTDYYNDGNFVKTSSTEQLEVQSVSGSTVTLKSALQKARWGKLQYVTDTGMSLTPGTITLPDTGGKAIPTTLDERAEVGNISRRIVIQAADDALWKTQGFGAQLMVMDATSNLQLEGVELRRMGQAGKFGRYPIHFHNISYNSTGGLVGDVNFAVRNSSVSDSSQRCVVIHGTNGVRFENNICHDIEGHAVFLEDAVERRNTIQGNLILKVRDPAKPLLKHESNASAMWLTNPDNTVRGNAVADVAGHGYWLAFPKTTLGANKQVNIKPTNLGFGVFEYNVAHTVSDDGLHLDNAPVDSDVGNLEGLKYSPTTDGSAYNYQNGVRFTIKGITSYKNGSYWGGGGGMWNRNVAPDYLEWVSADHHGEAWFAGAGDNGLIARSLVIGTSLNNATPRHHQKPLSAIASYHSTFDITQNVIVNFPFSGNEANPDNLSVGAFKTADYYISGLNKGLVRNPDNKLINASPGRRVQPFVNEHWTIAGALWDPHGYWGSKGQYWVYDEAFFTTGTTCQSVQPAGKNGSSCQGPYYGLGDFLSDFDTNRYNFRAAIEVTRVDASGSSIGTWSVGDGNTNCPKLCNMRNFAALKGGRYILRFPDGSGGYKIPTSFATGFSNLLTSNDWMLFAVSFTGARDVQSVSINGTQRIINTAGASIQAVQDDTTGKTYHQDKANNLIWVKAMGGFPKNPYWDQNPNSDDQLYQTFRLEIR